MTKPIQKNKKQKRIRTPQGVSKKYYTAAEKGKAHCKLCDRQLHGTVKATHAVKYAKTERRPSAPFAGSLCNGCRKEVIIEAVKVRTGLKELPDTKIQTRGYIEQALNLFK